MDRLGEAADAPDLKRYLAARYELWAAMRIKHLLRHAELGPAAVGDWIAMNPADYTDDEAHDGRRRSGSTANARVRSSFGD